MFNYQYWLKSGWLYALSKLALQITSVVHFEISYYFLNIGYLPTCIGLCFKHYPMSVIKIYFPKRRLMQYQLQGEYLHWKCSLCVESYGILYIVPLSFKIINLNSGVITQWSGLWYYAQLCCCWLLLVSTWLYWNCWGKDKVIFLSCCQFWNISIIFITAKLK